MLLPLLNSPGHTAEITLNGSIGSAITLSDNIDLEPDDQRSSGLVWTQKLGIDMRAEGASNDVAVNGTLNLDTIVNDGTEVDARPDLVALSRTELVDGLLFFDGGVSWQRQPITSDAGLSATTGFNREETAQVFGISLSPILRSRLGEHAKGELRYRYARNLIGSDAVRETEVNQQIAVLQSDRPLYPLRLTLTGEHNDVDQLGGEADLTQLTGTLRTEYAFSPRSAVIGIVGYEDITGGAVEPDIGGPIVGIGFRLQPGPGTEIEATVGYRYRRPNAQALIRHKVTERIRAVASYSSLLETPLETGGGSGLTIDSETGQIVNAVTRLPLAFSVSDLQVDDSASLTDRFDAALIGTFGRNTASLGVRWEQRDFANDPDENLTAVLLRIERQLTSRFTVALDGNYRHAQADDEPEPSDTVLVSASLSYEIGRSLYGFAAYSRGQRFSSTPADEYVENAFLVGLRMAF
jgi:uncharacterized protein (PEP-CTERM system associated)